MAAPRLVCEAHLGPAALQSDATSASQEAVTGWGWGALFSLCVLVLRGEPRKDPDKGGQR